MAKENKGLGKIILLGARLSFESLFEPNEQTDDDGNKSLNWKSNFLFEKANLDNLKAKYMGEIMPVRTAINKAFAAVKTAKWGDKEKWPKIKADRLCWRDGDEESWDGYAGCFYISASSRPKKGADIMSARPVVVTNRKDAKGNWIEAQPGGQGAPYSGCYVNATIDVWAQDDPKYGKRLNAGLRAVQFLKDGEAFGMTRTNPNEDFEDDMVGSEGSLEDEDDIIDGDDGTDDMV